MKFKGIFAAALVLVMSLTLAATASADTVRGKLTPDPLIAPKAGGSYVLKTVEFLNSSGEVYVVELSYTITARKLEPETTYRVGVYECEGQDSCTWIYESVKTNSRGSLKYSPLYPRSYESGSYTLQVVVQVEGVDPGTDPWVLYGEEVPFIFP